MSRLFAALYDRMLAGTEKAGLAEERAKLIARAGGDVVEIGAGTGLNLRHYAPTLSSLTLTEPDAHMAAKLEAKVTATRPGTRILIAPAEKLPLEDGSADTVVATLVLCTVDDPSAALGEIHRILRPGGRLLFFEHVRSRHSALAKWQDRLERPWGVIGAGCHPNRDTLATLEASPLSVEHATHTRVPKAPSVARPAIVGAATRVA